MCESIRILLGERLLIPEERIDIVGHGEQNAPGGPDGPEVDSARRVDVFMDANLMVGFVSGDPFLSALFDAIRLGGDLFVRPSEFLAALRRFGYATDPTAVVEAVPGAAEVAELVSDVEAQVAAFSDGMTLAEFVAALQLLVPIGEAADAIGTARVEIPSIGDPIDWAQAGLDLAVRLPQALLFDVIEYRSGGWWRSSN